MADVATTKAHSEHETTTGLPHTKLAMWLFLSSECLLFGALMDAVGWHAAFAISGLATLVLAVVWSIYSTDRPGQHPGRHRVPEDVLGRGAADGRPVASVEGAARPTRDAPDRASRTVLSVRAVEPVSRIGSPP